jgi:hypothetical protein
MAGIEKQDEHLVFEVVRYIDFCYIKLMKHDHGLEELEYITVTLEFLASGLKTMTQRHKSD